MENKNRPAFPTGKSIKFDFPDIISIPNHGITKRELFAAMAMQGYMASYGPDVSPSPDHVAYKSVMFADALLDELDKPVAST